MNNIFQRQLNTIRIQLNEQETVTSRRLYNAAVASSPPGYEVDPTPFNLDEPKKPSAEQRIADAYKFRQNLPWDTITAARQASVRQGMLRGDIPRERAVELITKAEKERKEVESEKSTDETLKTVEKVADVANTVAALGLVFSGAGAPLGLARLGLKTASGVGAAAFGAQAATDLYKGAMSDDPAEKQKYYERGTERAIAAAAAPVIGYGVSKAVQGAQKGAELAATLPAAQKAAEVAKKIPGAELVAKAAKAVKDAPKADAGGILGGMSGVAAGTQAITPDDNIVTAAGKVVGMGLLGQALGARTAGFLQGKVPGLERSATYVLKSPKERTAELVAQAVEKGPIPQGTTTITPRLGKEQPLADVFPPKFDPRMSQAGQPKIDPKTGLRVVDASGKPVMEPPHPAQVTPGPRKPPKERLPSFEVPSDKPVGVWKPNPEAQTGTGLSRRGASTQDYGYPRYPETHVGQMPPREANPLRPFPSTLVEPGMMPKAPAESPIVLWGNRGYKTQTVPAWQEEIPLMPKFSTFGTRGRR